MIYAALAQYKNLVHVSSLSSLHTFDTATRYLVSAELRSVVSYAECGATYLRAPAPQTFDLIISHKTFRALEPVILTLNATKFCVSVHSVKSPIATRSLAFQKKTT